jgi:bifunctional non-homologous end joining protein LigD
VPVAPLEFHAQLATLAKAPPEGSGWIHEVKYDGYRIGCVIEGGRVTLLSRNGLDWTDRFPEVAAAARRLPARRALLDGEVAVVLPDGRTSFQALQNARSAARGTVAYLVFDLLRLDREDLAAWPLLERKAALARLVGDGEPGVVRYAPHVDGDGRAVLAAACRAGLEGIVSKRGDAPYRPGRGTTWIKTKCVLRQELVIGGFTDPEGAARDAIGALLVGYRQEGALRFAGKVGTGFTNAAARALRRRLGGISADACPFSPPPRGGLVRSAHWVRPLLVAEIAFTEWTADGKIRHPSFQGLRDDKRPEDVVRERPVAGTPPSPARRPLDLAAASSRPADRPARGARVSPGAATASPARRTMRAWAGSASGRAAGNTATGGGSSTRRGSPRTRGSTGTRPSSTRSR